MILPRFLTDKINELYGNLNSSLKQTRENLTDRYKNDSGQSKDLVCNLDESILYAVSRMPATYSVIYTLINDLIEQGYLNNISSIIDVGSGTGAGYFALGQIFQDIEIELFEKNDNMIKTFNFLSEDEKKVNKFDLISDNFKTNADLVLSSYVMSEMTQNDREMVFKKLLDISKQYLLLIDTGTPKSYNEMIKLKKLAKQYGFKVIAPCCLEVCPLENDYCQFYARVERSSLLRQSKSGTLSYEDEKYFYLLFARDEFAKNVNQSSRVIRRPLIRPNEVELQLCDENGVNKLKVTKKEKEKFKRAKKIKINKLF